jgi:hypothetical protein
VHLAARAEAAGDDEDVRPGTIVQRVLRVDAELVSRGDRAFFCDCVHLERLQVLPPAADGEYLERPGEVEDFDFVEEQDRNAASEQGRFPFGYRLPAISYRQG